MTMHLLANTSIERDASGDVALVESYGISFHRAGPGAADDAKLNGMTGFRFVDRFERRAGGWRIAHRISVTESSRVDDVAGRWPVPDTLRHGPRDAADPVWWLAPELGLRRSDAADAGPVAPDRTSSSDAPRSHGPSPSDAPGSGPGGEAAG